MTADRTKPMADAIAHLKTAISIVAITDTSVGSGALTSAEFVTALVGVVGDLIATSLTPGLDPSSSAKVFADMLQTAIQESVRMRADEKRYAEFNLDGVARRVLAGIELEGREAEFALSMLLIDREGKMTPHARVHFERMGRKP